MNHALYIMTIIILLDLILTRNLFSRRELPLYLSYRVVELQQN